MNKRVIEISASLNKMAIVSQELLLVKMDSSKTSSYKYGSSFAR